MVGDNGSPLIDLIAAEDTKDSESLAPVYGEQLKLAFFRLSERDRYVVSSYHGLNGPQQSQREIGETLGISRSAVGQRRENALRRMRLMLRAG